MHFNSSRKQLLLTFLKKDMMLRNIVQRCLPVLMIVLFSVHAQSQEKFNIYGNAMISTPVQGFKSTQMFTDLGYGGSGGVDYFVNHFGIGINGGYFMNPSDQAFKNYISKRYLETSPSVYTENWKTVYALIGPVFKINADKFSAIANIKGGYSHTNVPTLSFYKTFFGQEYEMYRFSGVDQSSWIWTWSAGLRLQYRFSKHLAVHTNADYLATSYLGQMSYETTYRDAMDSDKSGTIEDSEYFESQKIDTKSLSDVCSINLGLGLTYVLSKEKKVKKPLYTEIEPVIPTTTVTEVKKEIPIVNLEEKEMVDAVQNKVIEPIEDQKSEPAVTNNFVAAEAEYDKDAAEFLYKAGESYFAANDFDNAMSCFNKLKADPIYPMAQYMFSLSLSALGNCEAAMTEYQSFIKNYQNEDRRTLEIIFASQIERCKGKFNPAVQPSSTMEIKPNESTIVQESTSTKNEMTSANNAGNEVYKIQFIAIKKPNKAFPNVESIGTIETEFYPNKSVYRYVLGSYIDQNSAIEDVNRIRALGFRDAFIAVYKNNDRVNTIYHSSAKRRK